MSITDPQLSIALELLAHWADSGSTLPSALNTAMWGWKEGVDAKEVMIHTGTLEEPEHAMPQVTVTEGWETDDPMPEGAEERYAILVNIWIPRQMSGVSPGALK